MPTKAQFRMTLLVVVGSMFAMSLPRIWAARHSSSDGIDGLVADTVNVAI